MSKPLTYYPQYVPLTYMEKYDKIQGLFRLFDDYAKNSGQDAHNIDYNKDSLFEIIDRVDKRKVYFRVFYKKVTSGMSELNEAALYCFWILKFAPFFNTTAPNMLINVDFAVHFFLKCIKYYSIKRGKNLVLTDNYVDDIKYAFKFRDISKESIMAIAEALLV